MPLGPTCPCCHARVPFRRTQIGVGKAFICRNCGTPLVMSRWQSFLIAFPIIAVYMIVRPAPRSMDLAFWLLSLVMVAAVAGMSWLFMKPQPVESDKAEPG